MVHFIIGEDNRFINQQILDTIDKAMFSTHIEYRKHTYFDYNPSFMKIIDKNLPNKIYILDIETPSNTGVEMARKIREKDIDSIIIFLTAYRNKYADTILENEFMFFAFISKKENYIDVLSEKIKNALLILSKKKAIRFLDCGILYTIPLKDILYITTDTQERKTILVTDYTTFKISKSMIEIESLLSEDFIKTHKSCIVNKERVIRIDMRENKIYFDNHVTIDLLSRKFKKEVKKELLTCS